MKTLAENAQNSSRLFFRVRDTQGFAGVAYVVENKGCLTAILSAVSRSSKIYL
jgi:hypothetical protein